MPVSISTVHPVSPLIKEIKLPWTVDDPPKVSKNWTAEEQKICTRVANAVLRNGKWSTASDQKKKELEGTAIRACIRAAGKTKFPGGRKSLEELSNQHLMGDFRLITDEYSAILGGGVSEFETKEELEDFADGVLNEILRRDITFHFSKFDDAARALMIRLYVPKSSTAILLRGSAPALITGGYKKAIVKGREFKFDEPLILAGESGLAFGVIRFHKPVVIGLEEFKNRFESHRITERERKRRWPDREEFYYYAIKDYLPFSEPKPIKNFPRPATVPIIKDVQMVAPSISVIVPEWLVDLMEKGLVSVHTDLHRIYEGGEDIHKAHGFVVEELERRGLEHQLIELIDQPFEGGCEKDKTDRYAEEEELLGETLVELGGPGSGHRGHKGVPGQRGGSRASNYAQAHIPSGFTSEDAETAADFIWTHERGEEPKGRTEELLDNLVLGESFDSLGDWADNTLNIVRSQQIIDDCKEHGILTDKDFNSLVALDVGRTKRYVKVIPDKDMIWDREAIEKEWGISRHSMAPMIVAGTAQYELGKGWNIQINKQGPNIKHTFWHEMGHTIPGSKIRGLIGPKKAEETGGAYIDRFANYMEKSGT